MSRGILAKRPPARWFSAAKRLHLAPRPQAAALWDPDGTSPPGTYYRRFFFFFGGAGGGFAALTSSGVAT